MLEQTLWLTEPRVRWAKGSADEADPLNTPLHCKSFPWWLEQLQARGMLAFPLWTLVLSCTSHAAHRFKGLKRLPMVMYMLLALTQKHVKSDQQRHASAGSFYMDWLTLE